MHWSLVILYVAESRASVVLDASIGIRCRVISLTGLHGSRHVLSQRVHTRQVAPNLYPVRLAHRTQLRYST